MVPVFLTNTVEKLSTRLFVWFSWRSTKVHIATGIRYLSAPFNLIASFPRVLANEVHFSQSQSFPEPCSMAHYGQRNKQHDFEVVEPAIT